MEEDRAIADLGPDVLIDGDVNTENTVPKVPKRRFIGRKAADAKAAARAEASGNNATIEETGAVQGTYLIPYNISSKSH
jgi:2-(3-amino-3-carboxypropyl)histidine synthase